MSLNKKNWYFGQPVKFSEMLAFQSAFIDALDARKTEFGHYGIASDPLSVSAPLNVVQDTVPGLSCEVTAGKAYNKNGLRILRQSGVGSVDLSVDVNSASVIPSAGMERYISLFVLQDFAESDPRLDGNGLPVNFQQDLSHTFEVIAGAEAAPASAVKPALRNDAVLLADVLLNNSSTAILNAAVAHAPVVDEFDLTRTESWIRAAEVYEAKRINAKDSMSLYGSTASGVAKPNGQFTHEGLVQAWAAVTGAGGVLSASYNSTAAVRNGVGDYTLTIPALQALADVKNCAVIVVARLGAGAMMAEGELDPTDSTQVFVRTFNSAGAAADKDFHAIIIGRTTVAGGLFI